MLSPEIVNQPGSRIYNQGSSTYNQKIRPADSPDSLLHRILVQSFSMPSNIPATTIRIEPEVKKEATAILDELGLSMSTAVNAFLKALVREGGMPFEMKVTPRKGEE